MSAPTWAWVRTPSVVFGVICRDGIVIASPPVGRWLIGMSEADAATALKNTRGATFQVLTRDDLVEAA